MKREYKFTAEQQQGSLTIECEKCKAKVGEFCFKNADRPRSKNFRYRGRPHPARVLAWLGQQEVLG